MRKMIGALLACAVLTLCCGTMAAAVETQDAYVTYEEHGAAGDGVTDDFAAIIAAHTDANARSLPVRANDSAVYYIGDVPGTAVVKTDTDWGSAKFVIDDRALSSGAVGRYVFQVASSHAAIPITTVSRMQKDQDKLDITLPQDCLVAVTDSTALRFIRRGADQNAGTAQMDVFIVDQNGVLDPDVPLMWDYENVTSMTAYPIDEERLSVRGGHFTTIANGEAGRAYYERGIGVTRSNVELSGITHAITGEGAEGSPYNGFVHLQDCANVTVRGSLFSGHKPYAKPLDTDTLIGKIENEFSLRGTYDIRLDRAVNAQFINCGQLNDILDRDLWGIMSSNFSKNVTFDGCELSRFDAHMGIYNAAIKNSTIGCYGITVTGFGLLLIENSTLQSGSLVNLRYDYGSFWDGEIVIRNCVFEPFAGRGGTLADKLGNFLRGGSLVSSINDGQWDFGYPCMMPEKITVDGLTINDRNHPVLYFGPRIFDHLSYTFGFKAETYPYLKTREVTVKDVKAESIWCLKKNKPWTLWLLRDTKVEWL